MPLLAQYDHATGAIRGIWSAGSRELLLAQMPAAESEHGYLLLETGDPALLQERHEVREGQLVPRREVQLRASSPTFAADGVTECRVQVEPFVACTLRLLARGRESLVEMTTAEDPLVLTADQPQIIVIQVEPLPGWWAPPLQIAAV